MCPSCTVPPSPPSVTPSLGKLLLCSQLQICHRWAWFREGSPGQGGAARPGQEPWLPPSPSVALMDPPRRAGKLCFPEQNRATLPKHPTNARCISFLPCCLFLGSP